MNERRFSVIIIALAIAGLLFAGYLFREHYVGIGSSFCNLSSALNCDVVNKSAYAVLLGIPVALLGIFYYIGLLGIGLFPRLIRRIFGLNSELFALLLFGYALIGLLFSAYLFIIEAAVLHVFCPLCVCSTAIVVFLNGAALAQWLTKKR